MTNLVLIGMPAAGKSTIARALATLSGWALVDTDALLEAWWGAPLQTIRDHLGLEGFLDAEEAGILRLGVQRAVVATGGSVVYRETAMDHLRRTGWVVYLHASLETIISRLHNTANRGLAMRPHQSLADLYAERAPLYSRFAHWTITTDTLPPNVTAQRIWDAFLQKMEKMP